MRVHRLVTALAMAVVVGTAVSAAAAPAVPTPTGPANGASVQVPFNISWSPTLAASDTNGGYNWQVSRSSSFSPLVLMDSTNPATTGDTISGLTAGTYFWRVQAVDGTGSSAWSVAQSFIVTGAGPGTPGTPVLGPTQGYSTFHPWESIQFHWSVVPDAVTYRLEVSNDPAFPLGPTPSGIVTFWNDNIPTNTDGYVHTIVGNWYARVFAVSADNPQDGVRSLPSNVIQFSCLYNNPIGPAPQLLSPVDGPTLTLPVTLTWAHVPNPQAMGYVLQVARDAAFTDVEWFFNQYTEPSVEMLSLTAGPKFWRVLSQHGLSSPTTNANTAWSSTGRFTISSAPSTPVSITPLGNPQMVMYSGASGMIAVQLTAGVPAAGATVTLSSSHPAAVPIPATISIPGTHAWAQFPITVGQVTSPTLVTLTATLNGVSASSQLTLRPPTLNDQIFQAAPTRATGGATMTGWVDLEGGGLAGPGGFNVSLSTDSAAAAVPAAVTIPAGVSGTSFSIETSPVATTTTLTITAFSGGVTTRWPITLTPAPAPTSLVVRPMSTTNGSQGIVTAAEGAGADQLIHVVSSNPSLAAVPGTVTITAGSGVGFFTITTALVSAPATVTISVSGGGVTLSHPLTLYPTLPALASLTVSPATVAGGSPSTGTITLAGPAPAAGVAINVGSNLPLAASVPASVTIPGGATSASFTVTTFPVDNTTVQLHAAMDNVFQFAAITVNRPAPAPSLSAIAINPASVVGGNASTGTVTLSGPAPAGGVVVSLSDNSTSTSVPASITVPAGSTSAAFTIPTTAVATSTTATVSAISDGVTRTATLTANPAPPGTPSLLAPANDATSVQPVALDWTDVTNAASYEIQIDDSSAIAAPFVATATVTTSQATIGGLPAQRLWWRVRARDAAGVAGPFSATRRFIAQAAATTATLSAVSMNPATVVGGSGSTGTVTLTSAAPAGGAVVSLSSSNTAIATTPASVTIAAGAATATFAATTSSVAANTSLTITATYGGISRTATLSVTAAPPAASLQALTMNPVSVTGGTDSIGTVTLSSASPAGGIAVTLSSSNPAAAAVPATVTIAAGATSATFTAVTSTVPASTPVTISATRGSITKTATLTVTPPSQAVSLTVTASGRSGERVTSSPAGINVSVGTSGSASFNAGASITLTVTNGRDAIWSGACSSGGSKSKTCTFTLNSGASVTANVQ